MTCRIRSGLAALGILLSVGSVWGHHSFTVVFDPSKTFTVAGTLTKVDWRNPHIELALEVRGNGGQTEPWAIEAGPPSFFRNQKVNKAEFERAIGQTVTVEALRARDGSRLGSLLKITFEDGISVRSSPGA